MTCSEWIEDQLVAQDILPEDTEPVTRDMLLMSTDLTNEEIDDLIAEYAEFCQESFIEPVYDFD